MKSLTVLDISPTLKMYQSTTLQFAKAYWHWFFLIQEAPLPERLLAGHVPWYILKRLGRGKSSLKYFDRRAIVEYTRAFRDPRTIHATCEDYRAAATIDLMHDKQDARKKLVDLHKRASLSKIKLYRAAGGPGAIPTPQPTTQPVTQPIAQPQEMP